MELDLEGKRRVLRHLGDHRVKLDISGGDPLSVKENYVLLREASELLGRDQITLTATGAGLATYAVSEIVPYVGELNFTYDGTSLQKGSLRPATYAKGNLRKARQFADAGVRVRGECPLTVHNSQPQVLRRIYQDLHDAGVETLLVMRLFPVGRGVSTSAATPNPGGYRAAIDTLRQLERANGSPKVKLQCALKHLDGFSAGENPCDAITQSFGLTPQGILLGSPWAVDAVGRPMDDAWVLGNLADQPLSTILLSHKAANLRRRADENHGHCKIFSWLNGRSRSSVDRIFEKSDPLYRTQAQFRADGTA
ncbi:hypothetical protein AB0F68_06910 [Micromonospora sp. NPDC023966]|uniref:hypothetical protein n=1 Tax=Micromonospora sp. NPDC023966 TaxID=3154699 RepID=UPI0033E0E22A